jgi:hypothetical protein
MSGNGHADARTLHARLNHPLIHAAEVLAQPAVRA